MSDASRERMRAAYRSYSDDDGRHRRWSLENPGNHAMVAEKVARVDDALRRWSAGGMGRPSASPAADQPPDPVRVLDLGCGSGSVLPDLSVLDAPIDCVGVDVLLERLITAVEAHRGSTPPELYVCADGSQLPLPDASIDLVLINTVLSSVLDDGLQRRIAADVQRVMRPGALMLWYDMRMPNPSNRQIRPVTRRRLHELFPHLHGDVASITLIPQLARRLGSRTDALYPALTRLAPLRSHLFAAMVRN